MQVDQHIALENLFAQVLLGIIMPPGMRLQRRLDV